MMTMDIRQKSADTARARAWGMAALVLLCVLASSVALADTSSSSPGSGAGDAANERPIYLDVIPVAGAEDTVLPAGVIVAMAREALSTGHQAVIRMDGQTLPPGVRVLRILYIVHEQSDPSGTTLAASASTALLRTATDSAGRTQVYSTYSGLQQTLVQGPDEAGATKSLRAHFKQELQSRIASAFAAGNKS